MRRWLDALYIAAGWLAAGCIAGICLLVVCQVLLNLVDRLSTLLLGTAIGRTIPSYSDFTGFMLAAASFFMGLSWATSIQSPIETEPG